MNVVRPTERCVAYIIGDGSVVRCDWPSTVAEHTRLGSAVPGWSSILSESRDARPAWSRSRAGGSGRMTQGRFCIWSQQVS